MTFKTTVLRRIFCSKNILRGRRRGSKIELYVRRRTPFSLIWVLCWLGGHSIIIGVNWKTRNSFWQNNPLLPPLHNQHNISENKFVQIINGNFNWLLHDTSYILFCKAICNIYNDNFRECLLRNVLTVLPLHSHLSALCYKR